MKKIKMMFCLIFLLSHLNIIAQTSITGKVTDEETKEEMIGANIVVFQNGVFVQGQPTDIDGGFNVQVESGTYDIEVSYTGYPTKKVEGIFVTEDQSTKVDVQLKINYGISWGCRISIGWVIPLIRQDEMSSEQTITNEQIRKRPVRKIKEISLSTPGVSFSQ